MVHLHSLEARRIRWLRAIARGFINPRPAKSTAQDSIYTAKGCVLLDQIKIISGSLPRSIDPIFASDPWACCLHPKPQSSTTTVVCDSAKSDANPWALFHPPVGPPGSLRADAEPFSSELQEMFEKDVEIIPLLQFSETQHTLQRLDPWQEVKHLQQLVDAQNSTIALLVDELKSLRSVVPAASSSARLDKLEDDMSRLACSLSGAIQSSLDQRLEQAKDNVVQIVEQRFYQYLRPHVDELIVPLIQSSQSSTTAQVEMIFSNLESKLSGTLVGNIADAIKQYDGYIQGCIEKALERRDTGMVHSGEEPEQRAYSLGSVASCSDDPRKCATIECSQRVSCSMFLKMAAISKARLPHIQEVVRPYPMLRDGFLDPDEAESIDSELTSEGCKEMSCETQGTPSHSHSVMCDTFAGDSSCVPFCSLELHDEVELADSEIESNYSWHSYKDNPFVRDLAVDWQP